MYWLCAERKRERREEEIEKRETVRERESKHRSIFRKGLVGFLTMVTKLSRTRTNTLKILIKIIKSIYLDILDANVFKINLSRWVKNKGKILMFDVKMLSFT